MSKPNIVSIISSGNNGKIKIVFSRDREILEMNPRTEISKIEYAKRTNESLERKYLGLLFNSLKKSHPRILVFGMWNIQYT